MFQSPPQHRHPRHGLPEGAVPALPLPPRGVCPRERGRGQKVFGLRRRDHRQGEQAGNAHRGHDCRTHSGRGRRFPRVKRILPGTSKTLWFRDKVRYLHDTSLLKFALTHACIKYIHDIESRLGNLIT